MTQTQPNSSVIEAGKKDPNLAKATYGRATLMATRQESRSIITLSQLQEQFRQLCITGMRGADAIAKFREDPIGNLEKVKESTAQLEGGLSKLRHDIEKAKVALSSGEEIFRWEYKALEKIAVNAGIPFDKFQKMIKVQNGSVVELRCASSSLADLASVTNLTSLKTLYLYQSQVSDISPLANLSALEELKLWHTQITNLTPLSSLPELKMLDLSSTRVLDLSALPKLTTLEKFCVPKGLKDEAYHRSIAELKAKGVQICS